MSHTPRWLSVSASATLALLLGIGALADVGGAWQGWTGFVDHLLPPPSGSAHPTAVYVVPGIFALVVLAILLSLLTRVVTSPPSAAASARDDRRQARRAERAAEIRRIYLEWMRKDVENRLHFSLHRVDAVDLESEETRAAVQPWYFTSDDPHRGTIVFARPEEAFEHYGRRMLLLGSPGSGKTTSLQQIALRLVDEALRDERAPVPLLLNLSRFTAGRQAGRRTGLGARLLPHGEGEDGDLRFERWLVESMLELGVGELRHVPELVAEWVREGGVALLLDGLDEVADNQMVELARLLNRGYLSRHTVPPAVVCSRIIEYRELQGDPNAVLRLNGAATLHPLSRQTIDAYLTRTGAGALRDALPGDEVLYEMASNPLTLSIMRLAYANVPPDVLARRLTPIERRVELFDAYVVSMLQRQAYRREGRPFGPGSHAHPLPTDHSEGSVRRWLGWLAVRLSERAQTVLTFHRLYRFLASDPARREHASFWSVGFATTLCVAMAQAAALGLALPAGAGAWAEAGPWAAACAVGAGLVVLLAQAVRHAAAAATGPDGGDAGAVAAPRARVAATGALVAVLAGVFLAGMGILGWSLAPPGSRMAPMAVAVLALAVTFAFFVAVDDADRVGSVPDLVRRKARWIATGAALLAPPFVLAGWRGGFDDPVWAVLPPSVVAVTTLGICGGLVTEDRRRRTELAMAALIVLPIVAAAAGLAALAGWLLTPPAPGVVALVLALALGFPFLVGHDAIGLTLVSVLAAAAAGLASPRLAAPAAVAAVLAGLLAKGAKPTSAAAERALFGPVLRGVLALVRRAPPRYRGFLDHCVDAVLLRRVGAGEYEFVHRMLRDHFAVRELTRALAGAGTEAQLQIVWRLSLQGESAFETLKSLAVYPDPVVRGAAVAGLGRLGLPDCARLLEEALRDRDPSVRRVVPRSLARLPRHEAQRILLRAAADPDVEVRLAVLDAYASGRGVLHLDRNTEVPLALLDTTDPRLIERMVAVCARMPDLLRELRPILVRRARGYLDTMVRSRDANVRAVAAQLLGYLGDAPSERALLAMLDDAVPAVADAAADALGEARSTAAIPILLDRLRRQPRPSPGRRLRLLFSRSTFTPRMPLVQALARIGAIAAVPALREKAGTEPMPFRAGCLEALGRIGDPRALPELLSAAREGGVSARIAALGALGVLYHEPGVEEALVARLRDRHEAVVDRALAVLAPRGHPAVVEVLLARLRTGGLLVRHAAARLLAGVRNPAVAAALVDAFRQEDPLVHDAIFPQLVEMGETAVPAMLALLRDEREFVRRRALRVLGSLEGPVGDVAAVRRFLGDPVALVRLEAARLLVWRGDDEAVRVLRALVDEGDAESRLAAAELLLRAPDGAAPPAPLLPLLESPDPVVRARTARVLGLTGNRDAVPLLRSALRDAEGRADAAPLPTEAEWPPTVHLKALLRLGELDAVLPHVDRLLARLAEPARRDEACFALAMLADPEDTPFFARLADDVTASLPAGEAAVMKRIRASAAVPALANALESGDWRARASAAFLLGRIGDASVLPSLVPFLGDDDGDVRRAAGHAVARLGGLAAPGEPVPAAARPPHALDVGAWAGKGGGAHATAGHGGRAPAVLPGGVDAAALIAELEASSPDTRAAAAAALGHMRAREAVVPLLHALWEDVWYVRATMTRALEEIGEAGADDLAAVARTAGVEVRCEALRILGMVGGAGAARVLVEALSGETNAVRVVAAEGLALLADPATEPALRDARADRGVDAERGRRVCDAAEEALRTIAARRTDGAAPASETGASATAASSVEADPADGDPLP